MRLGGIYGKTPGVKIILKLLISHKHDKACFIFCCVIETIIHAYETGGSKY